MASNSWNESAGVTADWDAVPFIALGPNALKKLSLYLNPERDTANNWRFLAEQLDYEQLNILNWRSHADPTNELLSNWGCNRDSSVGKLVKMLQLIEREDVISDIGFLFEQDVLKWVRKRQEEKSVVQVPEVSSVVSSTNELSGITLYDNVDGQVEVFDAFVCYCQEDFGFVKDMMRVLETERNLKLYIDGRDLMAGVSKTTATAELIANRCRRMVVILSPAFREDDFNNFCIKFGISLQPGGQSKRVIPVIVAPCKTPSILMHLTALDYTKRELRSWFWDRLEKAIIQKL